MALNFTFAETKTARPSMTFSPEFAAEFDQAWTFLKENPGHQATVIFETAAKRDKWFNMAKVYGAQHAEKVFISKVKGSGSDDKNSGKLVFKMEAGDARDKRIAEAKARGEMFETLRLHGIDVKRGVGSNVDDAHAKLMKMSEADRKNLRDKHAANVKKAEKAAADGNAAKAEKVADAKK